MGIADRLKQIREDKGLSVAELAEAAGVSKPYIWQIESGRRKNPSGDKMQHLATALGITIADLLGTTEGIAPESLEEAPESLKSFIKRRGKALGIRREDVEMLKHIHYRGRRPVKPEDWELIYTFLKRLLEP